MAWRDVLMCLVLSIVRARSSEGQGTSSTGKVRLTYEDFVNRSSRRAGHRNSHGWTCHRSIEMDMARCGGAGRTVDQNETIEVECSISLERL